MTAEIGSKYMSYRRVPKWVHRTGWAKVILAAPDIRPLALSGLGAAIWIALDDPGTEAEVMERLEDLFERPPSTAATDAFVHLLEAGIIEPAPQ